MTGARATERKRGARKIVEGRVASAAMAKSVVVEVETRKRHPVFHKMVRRTRRFLAHDEKNEARVGDVVRLMETRPLSKLKRWRLVAVVKRAE